MYEVMEVPEARQKEIFLELMTHPENGEIPVTPENSVMARFGVPIKIVQQIRRRGMAGSWPPLD